jgi:peptidoglycan/xylan/chitin deacetylase (PgdA/CDA1 family)
MFYDPLIRAYLGHLSPAGQSAQLTILIFHRVLAKPDPLFPAEVDTTRFAAILSWMNQWFNLLPLEEAAQRLARHDLPARAACITFDDGYGDKATDALPILQQYSVPATFFVATGYLNGGLMWNDTIIEAVRRTTLPELYLNEIGAGVLPVATNSEKRSAIDKVIGLLKYRDNNQRDELASAVAEHSRAAMPDDLMLNDDGVRKLHEGGMGIGAHTVDHPILRLCDDSEARRQITESRDYLEAITGDRVSLFAYPNGKPGTDYTVEQAQLVKKLGFLAAVSTEPGASRAGNDIYQLRRFTPWDRHRHRFALRLSLNLRLR